MSSDLDSAAVGHRFPRVVGQRDEDPLDLARIHLDETELAAEAHHQLHVGAERLAQGCLAFPQHFAQVENSWVKNLLAAEGLQLLGQGGRPPRGVLDLAEIARDAIAGPDLAPGQVGEPRDHGQEVVEVVRDLPRQATDRLQLLRLDQLLLELALHGDVTHDPLITDRRALLIAHDVRGLQHVELPALQGLEGERRVTDRALREQASQIEVAVAWVDEEHREVRRHQLFLGVEAEELHR